MVKIQITNIIIYWAQLNGKLVMRHLISLLYNMSSCHAFLPAVHDANLFEHPSLDTLDAASPGSVLYLPPCLTFPQHFSLVLNKLFSCFYIYTVKLYPVYIYLYNYTLCKNVGLPLLMF